MQTDTAKDPLAEVAKVKEAAERLARGQPSPDADQLRVLAGLVQELAAQVERLGQQQVATAQHAPLSTEAEQQHDAVEHAPLSRTE